MTLSEDQQDIIARGLALVPINSVEDAISYVELKLRPLREVADSDVRAATAAAVARYGTPMAAAFAAAGRVP